MRVGLHVSIAKNIALAPVRAHDAGAECFQIFSRSPHGGPTPPLKPDSVRQYRAACTRWRLTSYIHTPYYINLASTNPRVRYGSIKVIREELERGSALGVQGVITHLGSAKDVGEALGVQKTINGLRKALNGYHGSTQFLIELAAGAGMVMGDTFEEIQTIIRGVETTKALKGTVGVCLDTCHAFASGYDMRTPAAVRKTFAAFDRVIGLNRLVAIHANDAKGALGSHLDRHEHIGKGEIGLDGFRAMLQHPKLRTVDAILETPIDDQRIKDVAVLKKLRGAH